MFADSGINTSRFIKRIMAVLILVAALVMLSGCGGEDETGLDSEPGEGQPMGTPDEETPSPLATLAPTPAPTPDAIVATVTPVMVPITTPTPPVTPVLSGDAVEALIWPSEAVMVNVNQISEFEIWVNTSGKGLSAAEIVISFDKDILESVSMIPGDILGRDPIVGYKELDNRGGLIRYALARVGSSEVGFLEGVLAKISFRLKNDINIGATILTLKVALADDKFRRYSPTANRGTVIEFAESVSSSTSQEPIVAAVIKAEDIYEEFEANAIAANAKYKDKEISVVGVVRKIDYDFLNNPYVTVGSGGFLDMTYVKCMLLDASQTINLSVGAEITVEGTFSEWVALDVRLKPCSVTGS